MADELADVELSGVHSGAGFDSTRTMDPFSAASVSVVATLKASSFSHKLILMFDWSSNFCLHMFVLRCRRKT